MKIENGRVKAVDLWGTGTFTVGDTVYGCSGTVTIGDAKDAGGPRRVEITTTKSHTVEADGAVYLLPAGSLITFQGGRVVELAFSKQSKLIREERVEDVGGTVEVEGK